MKRGQPLSEETKEKIRKTQARTMARLRENIATDYEITLIQAEYGCDETDARRIIRRQRRVTR